MSAGSSSPASSGTRSATKSGSSGGSAAMKAGVNVKLALAGWHVPHVRPLPSNVSSKKSRAPSSTRLGVGVGPVDDGVGVTVSVALTSTGSMLDPDDPPHAAASNASNDTAVDVRFM